MSEPLSKYLVDIKEYNPESGLLTQVEYYNYGLELFTPNPGINQICWGSLALQVI